MLFASSTNCTLKNIQQTSATHTHTQKTSSGCICSTHSTWEVATSCFSVKVADRVSAALPPLATGIFSWRRKLQQKIFRIICWYSSSKGFLHDDRWPYAFGSLGSSTAVTCPLTGSSLDIPRGDLTRKLQINKNHWPGKQKANLLHRFAASSIKKTRSTPKTHDLNSLTKNTQKKDCCSFNAKNRKICQLSDCCFLTQMGLHSFMFLSDLDTNGRDPGLHLISRKNISRLDI